MVNKIWIKKGPLIAQLQCSLAKIETAATPAPSIVKRLYHVLLHEDVHDLVDVRQRLVVRHQHLGKGRALLGVGAHHITQKEDIIGRITHLKKIKNIQMIGSKILKYSHHDLKYSEIPVSLSYFDNIYHSLLCI